MGSITNYKINGLTSLPPKEWQELQVNATFDNDSVQANINFGSLNFVDDSNEIIKDWFINNVGITEGIPFEISINDTDSSGQNSYVPFTGYLDWATYKVKASNQSEMSLIKTDSLNGVAKRASGISMRLLQENGLMPTSLGVNIPYLIENRKTLLEKLQLIGVAYITVKTAIDEIFKLINITADITTLGVGQALINLTTTLLSLIVLINQLSAQLKAIQEAIFPLVRYHRGIKLITFLQKGAEQMGYTLDTGGGVFEQILSNIVLCPHKTDEEGLPVGFLGGAASASYNQLSGILKPNDFGYVLSEAFELSNKMFYTKIAVQGDIITLLPYNDPLWTLNPSYTMPNIKVEDTPFHSNGVQSFNIDELVNKTLIGYQNDDSDYWTITDVNDSFSETIVSAINVNNPKNITETGTEDIQIPYALCVRKNALDELFDTFQDLTSLNDEMMQAIKDKFDELSSFLDGSIGATSDYILPLTLREGAMKVENHFFSTPKIVYMVDGKIPSDFTDFVGAPALYNGYHSYKSFVQGVKNPNNANETNQKKVFTDVTIPFGASSFSQIINNSFFNDVNGNLGKFTSVSWNVEKDKAVVSYYIFENYTNNLKEVTL